jgi:hypothetical protein
MKLLNQSVSTRIVTTNDYEIPGVDPEHVTLRETITEIGGTLKTRKELHKTLKGTEYKRYNPTFVLPPFYDYIKKNHAFGVCAELDRLIVECTENLHDATIVWFCSHDHTLLDQNLEPLPFAITFDYCGTFFSDEFIDFNYMFLDFISNHPWVVNKGDIEVRDIPHYNARDGRDRYVEVVVCPDKETYKEIFDYSKGTRFNIPELLSGNPGNPRNVPDWFGIRPWLK